MNRTILCRAATVALAPVLAVGLTISPSAAAPADDAGSWLAGEVPDSGIVVTESSFGAYDDYGLTADVLVALVNLDVEPSTRTRLADALSASVEEYTTGEAFGDAGSRYAGATGKLTAALQLAGRDVGSVGGEDLVEVAESVVTTTGPATGRGVDLSDFGDFSNSIGQSWVVRALATAGSDLADEAATYLALQQCADGTFTEAMADAGCTSGSGSLDATGFALQALVTADAAGVDGLDDEIAAGRDRLLADQADDGSFAEAGATNSNTTGLAAAALEAAGETSAAADAAAWITGLQIGPDETGTPLADERGAVAFDPAAFEAGRAGGITTATRDQWRRATAQASLAVPFVAEADPRLQAPELAGAGETIDVEVTDLAADQAFTIDGGTSQVSGTAGADGTATATVTLPGDDAIPGDELALTLTLTADTATVTAVVRVLPVVDFDVVVPDEVETGESFEVTFGEEEPVDGEPIVLFIESGSEADVPQAAAEGDEVLASDDLVLTAPDEPGDYVVGVVSEIGDRSGVALLAVVAAVDPGADLGAGTGSGTDVTTGAGAPLPAAGATIAPWLPWAALGIVLLGAALLASGRLRAGKQS